MSQYKRIFIIGHPGAGKALVAKTLAKKLGWQFIDADLGLEFRMGRTLTEIIGKQGEEAFHQCLSDILSYQQTKENIVVTTDDSIICHKNNRELLSSEFAVYLKVSPSVQLDRIAHNRPLLPTTDYKAFLDKLRHERDDLYEQVTSFSLSSDNGAIEEHVSSIINAIEKYKP